VLTCASARDNKQTDPAEQIAVKRNDRVRMVSMAGKKLVGAGGRRMGILPSLNHFLILGAILFAISVVGVFLNRKNLIVLLMAIELMLLAVNMNFVAFSHYLGDMGGQVFVFFILTVAAAEAAIGLAILVVLFRNLRTIHVDDLDSLKG
jgi:NADH-quinone oxidoreductase subunit K